MSNRTSEATKAVGEAWTNEKERVLEGKGTRDWTPEQQRDIVERGKAYDENGKAFEGHHMKSAEAYPEYQGDPENIQFLTREEHFQAHDCFFQNPTNGYYDPQTGETEDFGENRYEPCKEVSLSEPAYSHGEEISQSETEAESESMDKLYGEDETETESEAEAVDENESMGKLYGEERTSTESETMANSETEDMGQLYPEETTESHSEGESISEGNTESASESVSR